MRVKIVLLIVTLLLGGGAIYVANTGLPAQWVELGHAATSERASDAGTAKPPPAEIAKSPAHTEALPGIPSRDDEPVDWVRYASSLRRCARAMFRSTSPGWAPCRAITRSTSKLRSMA